VPLHTHIFCSSFFDIATICFSVDFWLLLLETICVDITGSSILRISFCGVMLSSVLTVSFSRKCCQNPSNNYSSPAMIFPLKG
jgi:hypothetical protein